MRKKAKTKAELREEIKRLERWLESSEKEVEELKIRLDTLQEIFRGWQPICYPPSNFSREIPPYLGY